MGYLETILELLQITWNKFSTQLEMWQTISNESKIKEGDDEDKKLKNKTRVQDD